MLLATSRNRLGTEQRERSVSCRQRRRTGKCERCHSTGNWSRTDKGRCSAAGEITELKENGVQHTAAVCSPKSTGETQTHPLLPVHICGY
jgi:hypothetical protein